MLQILKNFYFRLRDNFFTAQYRVKQRRKLEAIKKASRNFEKNPKSKRPQKKLVFTFTRKTILLTCNLFLVISPRINLKLSFQRSRYSRIPFASRIPCKNGFRNIVLWREVQDTRFLIHDTLRNGSDEVFQTRKITIYCILFF